MAVTLLKHVWFFLGVNDLFSCTVYVPNQPSLMLLYWSLILVSRSGVGKHFMVEGRMGLQRTCRGPDWYKSHKSTHSI